MMGIAKNSHSSSPLVKVFLLCLVLCSGVVRSQDNADDDGVTVETPEPQVQYSTPAVGDQHLYEPFDDEQLFNSRWVKSVSSKDGSADLKYDGEWERVGVEPLKGKNPSMAQQP